MALEDSRLYLFLGKAKRAAKRPSLVVKSRKAIFTDIYQRNTWDGPESKSGPGSNLKQTETIRKELPRIIEELKIRSLLDAPCGDFHWMKEVSLEVETYIGCDIVGEVIKENQKKYADRVRRFVVLDITSDEIPQVDLILCRDAFVHCSFLDIDRALRNFKRSGSAYLLTTTFTEVSRNGDILTGDWRPLNMQLPPFNFPEPIRVINENCSEGNGRFAGKSLGLWNISEVS